MTMFRKQIKTNHVLNRTFNYSKGDTNLNFTLRVDIKTQLKDFKELLLQAIEDIDSELKHDTENHGSGGASGGGRPIERGTD